MGSITHLHERLRPVPLRIGSDEEVLSAAAEIAAMEPSSGAFVQADALTRSGILAISVPTDYGGADIANGMIAEAVARIAASRPQIAGLLANHFSALELVRNGGSEEQRRGLYARITAGARIWLVKPHEEETLPHVLRDGIGFRLPGALVVEAAGEPDWLALLTLSNPDTLNLALLQRQDIAAEAATSPAEAASLDLSQAHIAADCLLPLQRNARALCETLETLLAAAILLGERRRQLTSAIEQSRAAGTTVGRELELGELKVEIETLAALMERVASALDMAQVNGTESGIGEAVRLAATLRVTMTSSLGTATQDRDRLLALLGRALVSTG